MYRRGTEWGPVRSEHSKQVSESCRDWFHSSCWEKRGILFSQPSLLSSRARTQLSHIRLDSQWSTRRPLENPRKFTFLYLTLLFLTCPPPANARRRQWKKPFPGSTQNSYRVQLTLAPGRTFYLFILLFY